MTRLFAMLLLLVLVLAYTGLVFSSHGILIGSDIRQGVLVKHLECRYFTGISTLDKRYLYSETNTIGRAACPRTLYYGEE